MLSSTNPPRSHLMDSPLALVHCPRRGWLSIVDLDQVRGASFDTVVWCQTPSSDALGVLLAGLLPGGKVHEMDQLLIQSRVLAGAISIDDDRTSRREG
jgi:hypothetical protein